MRRKRRILVIDDNNTLRDSLRRTLAKEGHEVVAAPSAEEGLGLVLGHLFDLILVDLKLPLNDGDAFVRQVRSLGCRSEIIMMTGSEGIDPEALAKSVGARTMIFKGSDFINDVKGAVREILSTPQQIPETAN